MKCMQSPAHAADSLANLVLEHELKLARNPTGLVSAMTRSVQRAMERCSIPGKAMAQGSAAKGTWLGGSDVDVFMVLPRTEGAELFETAAMSVAELVAADFRSAATTATVTPMTASHPYATVRFDPAGDEIDIVPCYDVPATEIVSAVDRTPHHTRFMNENLSSEQKNDVRKLKLFMKGVGIYGADVWTGGFSGYACEVLVHTYGSFIGVLESERRAMDRILLDPVDPNRNVLASVTQEKFNAFKDAAGDYLSDPRITHFYPYMLLPKVYRTYFAVKQKAADENEAANIRAALIAFARALNTNKFAFKTEFFWKDGYVYALFSSNDFGSVIERYAPNQTQFPDGYASFVATHHGKPDRLFDESTGKLIIVNRIRNVKDLLETSLLKLGYEPSGLAEIGNVIPAAYYPTED